MLASLLILAFTVFLIFFFSTSKKDQEEKPKTTTSPQLKKLWSIAQTSMRESKPLRAEKSLLAILKFDEKNAAAYNRLGILYAKSQRLDEAIECFEIAQSLDDNPSSLHNAGLIYLKTGAFEKAAMAFRQALSLEGGIPARYLALAKAEEQLGHRKAAIEALEEAYELDRNISTLRQILAIHEAAGDAEAIATTTARIEAQIAEDAAKKSKRNRLIKPNARLSKPTAKLSATHAKSPSSRTKPTTNRSKLISARAKPTQTSRKIRKIN